MSKYRITIEPEPIAEFESIEEMQQWIERQKQIEHQPKPFPFDRSYDVPTQQPSEKAG